MDFDEIPLDAMRLTGLPLKASAVYSCTRKLDCNTPGDWDSASDSCVNEYWPGPQLESFSEIRKLTAYATVLIVVIQSPGAVEIAATRDCVPSNITTPAADDVRVADCVDVGNCDTLVVREGVNDCDDERSWLGDCEGVCVTVPDTDWLTVCEGLGACVDVTLLDCVSEGDTV